MSLLESIVFLDVVQVISSQDYGTVHFGIEDHTLENSASDGDVRSEWALLINPGTIHCGLWGFETKTNFLVVSWYSGSLFSEEFL